MKWSKFPTLLLSIAFLGTPPGAYAIDRVAVLDFELYDLTLIPNTEAEVKRTRSVAPLLRDALGAYPARMVIDPDPEAQVEADKAVGYLFDRPSEAAKLGRKLGVDWVAVGRLHKPSFLFAYLQVRLVDVSRQRLAANLVVEIKGQGTSLVRRGTDRLAEQIDAAIASSGD